MCLEKTTLIFPSFAYTQNKNKKTKIMADTEKRLIARATLEKLIKKSSGKKRVSAAFIDMISAALEFVVGEVLKSSYESMDGKTVTLQPQDISNGISVDKSLRKLFPGVIPGARATPLEIVKDTKKRYKQLQKEEATRKRKSPSKNKKKKTTTDDATSAPRDDQQPIKVRAKKKAAKSKRPKLNDD